MPIGICPVCKREVASNPGVVPSVCILAHHDYPDKIATPCEGSGRVVFVAYPDLDREFGEGVHGNRFSSLEMRVKIDDKMINLQVVFPKPMTLAEFGGSLPVMRLTVDGPPFKVYKLEGETHGEKQS